MRSPQQPKEYWLAHIKAWKESDLSQAAYCDKESLNLNQFAYQKGKLEPKNQPNVSQASSAFAVVETASVSSKGLTLTFLSGAELSGIDSTNLELAIKIMERIK